MSRYFELFNGSLGKSVFWFRGHGDWHWKLAPSALRYDTPDLRNRALGLLAPFKRFMEARLPNPPAHDEELKWVQLAQHYGLPTRLLDWTQNAAIALYFACLRPNVDGLVFAINPEDLNREVDPKKPRVFDAHLDAALIRKYLRLTGQLRPTNGRRTIAIHPTWNSERIMLQQGVFTLHGARQFALDSNQAPSLVCLPIRKEHKEQLLNELERIGVTEMSIFPEAEHICGQLKRQERLPY